MEILLKGGIVMIPLLCCSIISVIIFIERWLYYKKADQEVVCLVQSVKEEGLLVEAEKEILQSKGNVFVHSLYLYIHYLEGIITLAPLLGLLGTIIGMMNSFQVLSTHDGKLMAVTGGVGEALIATATGLCVAMIALIFHTILRQRQDSIIRRLEEVSHEYIVERLVQ